jgi:hypothetical protein
METNQHRGIPIRESFAELEDVTYLHPVMNYIDVDIIATYVPKLTWRERLQVVWGDRIIGAWRVLIGKAWAEEY